MIQLHRHLARACVAASAAAICLPAAAATPTDFAMPYSALDASGADNGLTLVSAANFAQSQVLVPAATVVIAPHMYYAGTVVSSDLQDIRPHSLVYATGGHWLLAPLRTGLTPTPVQVSSESGVTDTLCESLEVNRDFGTPLASTLFYRLPGANGFCKLGGDDIIKRVNLTDAPGTAPVTTTFLNLDFNPVYLSTGALQSLYTLQGTTLVRVLPDFTTQTTVLTAVDTYEHVGQTAQGGVIAIINGNLRRIGPNGNLAAAPLAKPATGFRISQAVLQDGTVYFVQAANDPNARFQSRIFSVPADGSANPATMQSLRMKSSIAGFTTGKMIFVVGGGVGVGGFLPTDVRSMGKTETADTAVVKAVYSLKSGLVTILSIAGDNVFLNAISFSPSFVQTDLAFVRSDLGAEVLSFGKGSQFVGGQVNQTFGVLDEQQQQKIGFGRLLLAVHGNKGTTRSAQLVSLDPTTLAQVPLVDLPNGIDMPFGFGIGPGSIGQESADVMGGDPQTDVFAFDLFGGRFRRITTTPTTDEASVF